MKTPIPPPNYTQTPNIVFDLLRAMSEAELKITLVLVRETFGWHRQSKTISLSDFERLTGLARHSAVNGVNAGLERGTIQRERDGCGWTYSLNLSELVQNLHQSEQPASAKSALELVQNLHQPSFIEKKNIKETHTHKEKGVCVNLAGGSKFSLAERQEYANAHGLGAGWVVSSANGRFDAVIEATLEQEKLKSDSKGAESVLRERGLDSKDCPDCNGTGRQAGSDQPCQHGWFIETEKWKAAR